MAGQTLQVWPEFADLDARDGTSGMSSHTPGPVQPGELPPEELARLAYTDDLTGLHNRRALLRFLHRALEDPAGSALPLCVVLLDLDHFKSINDTWGHLAGDKALAGLAHRLRQATRGDAQVFRYAGDEFVISIPLTSRGEAARAAERIRREVVATPLPIGAEHEGLAITLSMGVAEAPRDATDVAGLIEAADRALYAAKERGRNQVAVYGDHAPVTPPIRDLLRGFPCPRIVGRSTELARCEAASNFGRGGPPTLGLILGEAGTGKTRLMRELASRREKGGNLVLWLSCDEELRAVPYGALRRLFRRAFSLQPALQAEVMGILPDEQREALGEILEPRQRTTNKQGDEPQSGTIRTRAAHFDAFAHALCYIGRAYGAHIFADDLQFADAATLAVIEETVAGRSAARADGLVYFGAVATDTRVPVEGEASAFARFRRSIGRSDSCSEVALGPLDARAVSEMVDLCFPGHRFPRDFGAKIHAVTRGNPLFVEEVLIVLTLGGFLVPEGEGWALKSRARFTLPDRLDEVMLAHLGELDEETSRAVLQAAVIGSHFSVDVLRRVLEVNEGRALQMTDRAVQYRLFEHVTAEDGEEELRFVNRRLREITYELVDEDLRKAVHAKVASVRQRMRVSDLDEALAEIAWHYERAGKPALAAVAASTLARRGERLFREDELGSYLEVAGSEDAPRIETTIPEAVEPLSPEALELVPGLCTALLAARRGVQLYPPGSDYIQRALARAHNALQSILRLAPALTLKERQRQLEVNGQILDEEQSGNAGMAWVEASVRAHLRSVTFTRTATTADVLTLVTGMWRFSTPGTRPAWRDFLAERGCHALGVVPRRFRATVRDSTRLDRAGAMEGLAERSRELFDELKSVVRYAAGVAEAVQLFPRGSRTVANAVTGFLDALDAVFEVVPTVNLGLASDGFLLNDLRLDTRFFGSSVEVLRRQVERCGLKSISLHRGIDAREVEEFFRHLVATGQENRCVLDNQTLADLGIRHVGLDEYEFVLSDARGGAAAGGLPPEQVVHMDRQTFMRHLRDCQPAELLEPQVVERLPSVLSDLILGEDAETSRLLLHKLLANVQAPEPAVRASALDALASIARETSHIVRVQVWRDAGVHLADWLRHERSPAVVERLVALGSEAAAVLLDNDDLQGAARILWHFGRTFPKRSELPEEVRRKANDTVERIMRTEAFRGALRQLWTPNERRKALALHLIESCGHPAIGHLLELVATSPSDEDRRIFASQAAAVAAPGELDEKVASMVTPFAPAATVVRLLQVVDILCRDVVSVLVRAFAHPAHEVKRAANETVQRLPSEVREQAVLALLALPDPAARQMGAKLAGDHGVAAAEDILCSLATDREQPVGLRKEACLALGRIGGAAATNALAALLEVGRLRRLLGRGPPTELRVAAVWALAQLRQREERAGALVEAALEDPDDDVRRAAATALAI